MYRLGIEILLGLRKHGSQLRVAPCIPRHWEGFDARWRHGESEYRIRVENPDGVSSGVRVVILDGSPLEGDSIPLAADGGVHEVEVVLGAASTRSG